MSAEVIEAEVIEKVAFWNCGLAPLTKNENRASEEVHQAVARTVDQLVRQGASILGLCEVDEASLRRLRASLPGTFGLRSCVKREGRNQWDLGLAFNREVWDDYGSSRQCVARYGNHTYKAGWRRQLRHRATGIDVAVYVAHWRSRLNGGEIARNRSGMELGERTKKEKCPVILMGDFNDEPFDMALGALNASRDINFVRERPNMLFNPFWRHFGHEDRHDPVCGTYYHRGGETTRWRTFDQILISAQFLEEHGLLYAGTDLVRDPPGPAHAKPPKRVQPDHLPVVLNLVVRQPKVNRHD